MVGWVQRQEDARAQSVQAAPKACMQPAELQRIGCKRALQAGSNDLPSAPVCTAITAIPAALSSYANSMQTKLKHKSKLKSKLISCIIVCSIWMASWCNYVQHTWGKKEAPPPSPRDATFSSSLATGKGFRASCAARGLMLRYCSTLLENVVSPSGSLSRCCSSGASQGRAITAEYTR